MCSSMFWKVKDWSKAEKSEYKIMNMQDKSQIRARLRYNIISSWFCSAICCLKCTHLHCCTGSNLTFDWHCFYQMCTFSSLRFCMCFASTSWIWSLSSWISWMKSMKSEDEEGQRLQQRKSNERVKNAIFRWMTVRAGENNSEADNSSC